MFATTTRLERPEEGALVVAPPHGGPGNWAGAPSATVHDGVVYLAYRLRVPLDLGRGYANVIARSADGVAFETLTEVSKHSFGAESLERPAIVVTPSGRWRLYVSVATPGTKHWRVDLVEADRPEDLGDAQRATVRTVLPGSDRLAVKDPVVLLLDGTWHLWASVHPLDDPGATDRMRTDYATSPDGVEWTWQGTALSGRKGEWDERGTRIAAVIVDPDGGPALALFDGRASAEENWEERTGLAVSNGHGLRGFRQVSTDWFAQSPYGAGGLRYAAVITEPKSARRRVYYEMTRFDGAHELRTCPLTAIGRPA